MARRLEDKYNKVDTKRRLTSPDNIDYNVVEVPKDKDPKKFTVKERRAEILQLIIQAGHPGLVSRTRLAERYGIGHPNIVNDIKVLSRSETKHIASDAAFITKTVYVKAVKELLKEKKYKEACEVLRGFNNWLFDVGELERSGQTINVQHNIMDQLSETYEKVVNANVIEHDESSE